MFKALDLDTRDDVIILDYESKDRLEELRAKSRANKLVCPACEAPLNVIAGDKRRHHFAHRDLGKCATSHESAELLIMRSTLYRMLKQQFDEVTVEEPVVDDLRPFDCWVERFGHPSLAYFLVDARLGTDDREALRNLMCRGDIVVHVIFCAGRMTICPEARNQLLLTPTERDLIHLKACDEMYPAGSNGLLFPLSVGDGSCGSLQYLDPAHNLFTTFRRLWCSHPPYQFSGHRLDTDLQQVRFSVTNGELVHPEEAIDQEQPPDPVDLPTTSRTKALCQFCGSITTDYETMDAATGQCECRQCAGVSQLVAV